MLKRSSNIERLFTIYQALNNKDKFVSETKVPPNTVDRQSQLAPYEERKGKCYTSADVQSFAISAYATPGVDELSDDGKKKLEKYLRETYFW